MYFCELNFYPKLIWLIWSWAERDESRHPGVVSALQWNEQERGCFTSGGQVHNATRDPKWPLDGSVGAAANQNLWF